MMEFNLFVTLRGPGGETEAANSHNPMVAESLVELLKTVIPKIAVQNLVEITGIRVVRVEGTE